MKLATVDTMHAIEKEAVAQGLSIEKMMENAGRSLGKWLDIYMLEKKVKKIIGLVGSGNNGGDTLIAIEYLVQQGWQAAVYLVGERPKADPLIQRVMDAGAEVCPFTKEGNKTWLAATLPVSGMILDGVLGTGIHLPLKPDIAARLAQVKTIEAGIKNLIVVAVDCPSGIDCDTGQAAPETIPADITICMAVVKVGLMKFPAFNLVGQVNVVDIGLPEDLPGLARINEYVVDAEMVKAALPVRAADAHKGTFGTALISAGSLNFTGAALLAGKAAYRAGAGLVNMAVPSPLYSVLAGQFPEATWLLLPNEQGVIAESAAELIYKNCERVTALLLGPGWGLEEPTMKFLKRLVEGETLQSRGALGFTVSSSPSKKVVEKPLPPLVLDADGLKLLAHIPGWYNLLPKPAVLTPHPGEMSILCGLSIEEIQADRMNVAVKFAAHWGHVVVLKGALTVVASPDGQVAIIAVATPALAKAGTGDVLAGIITGLRAQGVIAFEAAAAGAWIHAQAGLITAQRMGNTVSIVAGDVLENISAVFSRLNQD